MNDVVSVTYINCIDIIDGVEIDSSQKNGNKIMAFQPLNKFGIGISFLDIFVQKCGGREKIKQMSTAEVYEKYIRPGLLKSGQGGSYCAYMIEENKKKYEEYFATATVYVIHSRQSLFLGLVDSVKSLVQKDPTCTLWIDIFSLERDYEAIQTLSPEWYRDIVHGLISEMKYSVAVFEPLLQAQAPPLLMRTWCLWELYSVTQCSHSVNKFEIVTATPVLQEPIEGELTMLTCIQQQLFGSFEELSSTLLNCTICIEESLSTAPLDKHNILLAMKASACVGEGDGEGDGEGEGLDSITNLIHDLLRSWLLRVSRKSIDTSKVSKEHRCGLMNKFGVLLFRLGELAEGEGLLRKAVSGFMSKLGDQSAVTLSCMTDLAVVLQDQKKYGEAEPLHRQVLTCRRETLGDVHHKTLLSMCYLGVVLRALGQVDESELLLCKALKAYRAILSDDDKPPPEPIVKETPVYNKRGVKVNPVRKRPPKPVAVATVDKEAAEGSSKQSVETVDKGEDMIEQVDEEKDIITQQPQLVKKDIEKKEDTTVEEEISRESLRIRKMSCAHDLGVLYRITSKYAQAESLLREAMECRRIALGDTHCDTRESVHHLGRTLQAQKQFPEAESLLEEALNGYRVCYGDSHRDTLDSSHSLGLALHDQGKLSHAEPLLRNAVNGYKNNLGASHICTLTSISNLALLLECSGNLEEAELLLREAVASSCKTLGESHVYTLILTSNLGELLAGMGDEAKTTEAEEVLKYVLEKRQEVLGESHIDSMSSLHKLAGLLKQQKRRAEVEELLQQGLKICKHAFGKKHPTTGRYNVKYNSICVVGIRVHVIHCNSEIFCAV